MVHLTTASRFGKRFASTIEKNVFLLNWLVEEKYSSVC